MDIFKHLSLGGSQFKETDDYLREIDADLTALYLLSQGNIASSNIGDDSLVSWTSSILFSSTDENTVTWASGSIVLAEGTTYTITSSNTGNMSALTYIYFDKGTSTTDLQASTTASDAVGNSKILIAVAENNDGYDAIFQVFNGSGGMVITTTNISTGAVTANEVATNTLTANNIAASAITTEELAASSITADKIGANAITTVKIEASAVTAQEIAVDTIQATHMHANAIYTDAIQAYAVTSAKIASETISSTNIAANAINANHINVAELSAISASMGTITSGEVVAASIRTANSGTRVIMDTDGLVGYDSVLGQVFKVPTDGSAPTFASGLIRNATIVDTTIYSDSFYSSSTLPYTEITSNGIAYREAEAGGLYNTFNYGDGTLYGTGIAARIFNTGEPILTVHKERAYSDVRFYNRSAASSGASVIGDLEVVSGTLRLCTSAGTPGTFKTMMTTDAEVGANKALSNLDTVAINTSLISDTNNTDDLGSDAKEWKDIWIDGTAYLDSADIDGGTLDGVQIGGTTATGEIIVNDASDDANGLGAQGNSGQFLTSAGAGANPTWTTPDVLVSGMITIWSGAISAIPTGHVICDGNNFTPNLTDRFVIHADADAAGTNNVGATGGASTHALSTAELAAHTHTIPTYTNGGAVPGTTNYLMRGQEGATSNLTSGSAGSGTAHTNRDKFYALAFIMKT